MYLVHGTPTVATAVTSVCTRFQFDLPATTCPTVRSKAGDVTQRQACPFCAGHPSMGRHLGAPGGGTAQTPMAPCRRAALTPADVALSCHPRTLCPLSTCEGPGCHAPLAQHFTCASVAIQLREGGVLPGCHAPVAKQLRSSSPGSRAGVISPIIAPGANILDALPMWPSPCHSRTSSLAGPGPTTPLRRPGEPPPSCPVNVMIGPSPDTLVLRTTGPGPTTPPRKPGEPPSSSTWRPPPPTRR